tara:strand:- start:107 stop:373 length:267 start_codon:yes stop_codon:yes gene_type:complete
MTSNYPRSSAITYAYEEIHDLKGLRNRYDIDDDDIICHRLSQEIIQEYDRRYDILCCLLSKARNYLWNISPSYREDYTGEFDTIMAVF